MSFVQELDQVEQLRKRITDLETQLQEKEQLSSQERHSSEQKFRAMMDKLPVILYGVDTNGIITLSEGKGLAIYGLKSGEAIGSSAFDLYKNFSEATAGLRRALAGESFQFIQKTGNVYMQTWYSPNYDENGQLIGTLGLMIDVSDRIHTEDELQESRNLLQTVLDAIPVRVFWKDTESKYVGCNQLFAQDAKIKSTNDLIGKSDYDFYPEDADAFRADDVSIIESGTSRLNFEEKQMTPDGKQMWLRTSKIPLRNVAGEIIGVLGTFDDITERKQVEVELRESKERLELAMDIAQLGRWDANLINNTTLFDARYEKMLGFLPGELAGANPTRVSNIHPDDMTPMFEKVMNYATGKTAEYEAEFRTETRDGNWRWIYAKAQIVERLPDGTPLRLEGVNQDITARKNADQERDTLLTNEREARREAQEALRMKDLFLATMSHELRTPLNAMIGFQHLMLFSQQLDADNSHMAVRSIANSQRLLNLINNILDISRIATGGLKIVPVNMSPRSLANGIGTDLSLQAKEKGLNLKVEVDDDVPDQILHDEERIGQIMLNLVGNALKFTELNGTITLRVHSAIERLVIEVQDTGIGIPASQKHVIFDDFVQLDNSSTRKHQGAGLGLAIVKRLALLMQGSITVESEIGQGSTFVVTLPLNLKPEMYQ